MDLTIATPPPDEEHLLEQPPRLPTTDTLQIPIAIHSNSNLHPTTQFVLDNQNSVKEQNDDIFEDREAFNYYPNSMDNTMLSDVSASSRHSSQQHHDDAHDAVNSRIQIVSLPSPLPQHKLNLNQPSTPSSPFTLNKIQQSTNTKSEHIQVIIRIKPINDKAHDRSVKADTANSPSQPSQQLSSKSAFSGVQFQSESQSLPTDLSIKTRDRKGWLSFKFDAVCGEDATQTDVFSLIHPAIEQVVSGVNTTVFAYGQTGTGE